MAALVSSKYSLRSLHEEIGLLDRKLAHLLKFEEFANDSARQQAAARIEHKRELLVRSARSMAEEGIDFQSSELPLSMRTEDSEVVAELPEIAAPVEAPSVAKKQKLTKPKTPFSGTVLDGAHALEMYKQEKSNKKPAAVSRKRALAQPAASAEPVGGDESAAVSAEPLAVAV